jgi:hypothetical protein
MSEIHNAHTAPLRAVNTSGFVPSFTFHYLAEVFCTCYSVDGTS